MPLIVRTFQPRFAPLVESGQKRQTIRPRPKRMPKFGDTFSARQWLGKPYRSKQRELVRAPITAVVDIRIDHHLFDIPGMCWTRDPNACNPFARADGFRDWADLIEWFGTTHDLPFEGILIMWRPPENSRAAPLS